MVRAVANDFAQLPDTQVSVFRDVQLSQFPIRAHEIIEIDSRGKHDEEFDRLASTADATLLIAPELDGVLLKQVRKAETVGAQLLSPSSQFVCIAADKHETASRLSAAGVAVPQACLIESDESLPQDFPFPAVLKPLDGCGSQDIYIVSSHYDRPPPYAWARRLEEFVPGLAVSVAVLGGPQGLFPLPACRQYISDDGRLRYLGGSLPIAPGLARRATELSVATLRAMPSHVGIVGVDLVLGGDPDGLEDAVIEVNPRLTTSYVGLRAASKVNLAGQMLGIASGFSSELIFDARPLEFDTTGTVSYSD